MDIEAETLDALLERCAAMACMACLHRFDDHAMGTWCQLVSCACSLFQGPAVRQVIIEDGHAPASAGEVEQGTSAGSAPPAA